MRHLDVLTAKQASIAEEEPRLDWIGGSATSACDAALDAILEAYRRQLGERATPTRALIVERLPKDWPTWPEMVYFRDEMISLGIETEIMDLESPEERLEYKSGTLRRVKGTRSMDVDLVYKRILWEDMRKCDEGSREALRRAYLDGAVCVVNSLGGRMAGSKMILAMLKCTALAAWLDGIGHNLTEEDRRFIEEHLPDTRIWGPTPEVLGWTQKLDRNDTLENPSPYVLKSYHGYGGKEVVIGCETKERPRAAFESCWGRGYVLQEFVPHGRAKVPLIRGQDVGWEYHNVVFGAYVINGQCVAIEAKTSPSLPINMARGAYRTAVFPVKSC
jgi:hypothetical protein